MYPKGVWFQRCLTVYRPPGMEVSNYALRHCTRIQRLYNFYLIFTHFYLTFTQLLYNFYLTFIQLLFNFYTTFI